MYINILLNYDVIIYLDKAGYFDKYISSSTFN